ncbi:MAG: pyrroline-5-carboxylate reductase [Nitrospirae bacterium]|nr:MAG: pyrroline-5-carboxylate reductase [Nitrospirota bacterium]
MVPGKKIVVIGAGNMGEALIAGMLAAGAAAPDDIHATDVVAGRLDQVKARYGVRVGTDNKAAASWSDIAILAVEPQVLDHVLDDLRSVLDGAKLILSVAAGYPIARIAARLASGARIVRCMPNTPSVARAGLSALAWGDRVTAEDEQSARAIFESVGRVVVVEERLMDAVTGLSGSGPAYVFLIIEALADGGVKMGLPREAALALAAQTVFGAAKMALETGEHPGRLKDRVTSPGGTTIAGLHALERGCLRASLMDAVEAATKRSRELGTE